LTNGEKARVVRIFKGPFDTCVAALPSRWENGTGIAEFLVVAEATVLKEGGGIGTLTITYESSQNPDDNMDHTGEILPPDNASLDFERSDRAIEKNPKYSSLNDADFEDVHLALNAPNAVERAKAIQAFSSYPLVKNLYETMRRGITHYALWTPVYKWKTYSWTPFTAVTAGGYPEDPSGPIDAPGGVGWLRQGDRENWTGKYWELERSWLGGPDLDLSLYP
jgi:hypothetical protein